MMHPERRRENLKKINNRNAEPASPIIAEDFDGPPGFYFEVCPACRCQVNYLAPCCDVCGQPLKWE